MLTLITYMVGLVAAVGAAGAIYLALIKVELI